MSSSFLGRLLMSNVKEYSYAQHFKLFSHANVMVRIALFENRAILCRKHDCTHRAFRFFTGVPRTVPFVIIFVAG